MKRMIVKKEYFAKSSYLWDVKKWPRIFEAEREKDFRTSVVCYSPYKQASAGSWSIVY